MPGAASPRTRLGARAPAVIDRLDVNARGTQPPLLINSWAKSLGIRSKLDERRPVHELLVIAFPRQQCMKSYVI